MWEGSNYNPGLDSNLVFKLLKQGHFFDKSQILNAWSRNQISMSSLNFFTRAYQIGSCFQLWYTYKNIFQRVFESPLLRIREFKCSVHILRSPWIVLLTLKFLLNKHSWNKRKILLCSFINLHINEQGHSTLLVYIACSFIRDFRVVLSNMQTNEHWFCGFLWRLDKNWNTFWDFFTFS